MTRVATLGALVEALQGNIGPMLQGTATWGEKGKLVDDYLVGLQLEAESYEGTTIRVDFAGTIGWAETWITGWVQGSAALTLSPSFTWDIPAGARYQVMLPVNWDGYLWGINEAIEAAAPQVAMHRIGSVMLTSAVSYEVPEQADELLGLEVRSPLYAEGYAPIPLEFYTVEERQRAGTIQQDYPDVESWLTVHLRQPLPVGQTLRVHYARYYAPITEASPATTLDRGYILAEAEARIRRRLANRAPAASAQVHLELMVDAQEKADARKAYLMASLGTAPPPEKKKGR